MEIPISSPNAIPIQQVYFSQARSSNLTPQPNVIWKTARRLLPTTPPPKKSKKQNPKWTLNPPASCFSTTHRPNLVSNTHPKSKAQQELPHKHTHLNHYPQFDSNDQTTLAPIGVSKTNSCKQLLFCQQFCRSKDSGQGKRGKWLERSKRSTWRATEAFLTIFLDQRSNCMVTQPSIIIARIWRGIFWSTMQRYTKKDSTHVNIRVGPKGYHNLHILHFSWTSYVFFKSTKKGFHIINQ